MSDGAINRLGNQLLSDLTPLEVRARREMQLRAIDNILDLVGAENIQLFLPMWETSGTTLRDLLRPDLTFTVSGAFLNQNGPFGGCLYFDGVDDYASRDPILSNKLGSSTQELQASTAVAVQKLNVDAVQIGFVRVKIVKKGTPDGSIRLEIRTAKDGAAIENGTSSSLPCESISTSIVWRGFTFLTAPKLQKNTTYYLALVYVGNTNADADKNISWRYDSAGRYGQGRNYYNGAGWTDTAGEDFVFEIYDDRLTQPDDWSFIVCAKADIAMSTALHIPLSTATMTAVGQAMQYSNTGRLSGKWTEGSVAKYAYGYRYPLNVNNVHTFTFNKALDTAKGKYYLNNVLIGSGDGTAATACDPIAHPHSIGCLVSQEGGASAYFQGYIGPILQIAKTLSAAEVAKIAHNLLVLRKLREAV